MNLIELMKVAIHTVFIAKENILFLEEWIDYHIEIGFGPFYLYDNSKVDKLTGSDLIYATKTVFQKINRHGVPYGELVKLTTEEVSDLLQKIVAKYANLIHLVEWSPVDSDGRILYNQCSAQRACLKQLKQTDIQWCANIDMDEFIVLNRDYRSIQTYLETLDGNIFSVSIGQILFDNRFNHIGSPILSINKTSTWIPPLNYSPKYIYNVQATTYMETHYAKGVGITVSPPLNQIRFNHYKLDLTNEKYLIRDSGVDPTIAAKIISRPNIVGAHLKN
jgi:hypothetical protein